VLKKVPHHPLSAIQAKFADIESLAITSSAIMSANAIGYSLEDVIDVRLYRSKRFSHGQRNTNSSGDRGNAASWRTSNDC
jgi:hypothetical protein